VRWARPLLVISGFLLAVAPARALEPLEPPLSEGERMQQLNEHVVARALEGCSSEATRRGEFKVVEVEFPYSRRTELSPRLASNRAGLDRKQYWCVAEALAALRFDPLPPEDPAFDRRKSYALGELRPLFPPALLPAWQRAGGRRDRVESALGSMLPADITVTDAGCLWLHGSSLLAGALDLWIVRTAGKPVVDFSGSPFGFDQRDHEMPDGWWLRREATETDSDEVDEEVCLEKLDDAAATLRRKRAELSKVAGFHSFRAEWVVDARGAVAGELGFCLVPPRDFRPSSVADVGLLRDAVEAVLRGFSYGPGKGLRRVLLGWGPEGRLATSVVPAWQPLTRASSTLEARCDQPRPDDSIW